MISYTQAILMGVLQGITELFPISSLGHSVILPHLLGWNVDQQNPFFLTFLVATHFATALTLFFFFLKDWVLIIKGMVRSFIKREIAADDHYAKLGWLLVVGTIPAGMVGLLLEKPLQSLFASAQIAAFFLIVNGIILYLAEMLRKKAPENKNDAHSDQRIAHLTWAQSLGVGISQVTALIPGISRSGATMTGSLMAGLSHEYAARYSFLLATPIIGAAALLKLPEFASPQNHALILPSVAGAIAAAIGAYFSTKFLLKYFETKKLTPFATYCVAAGVIFSVILFVH